MSTDPKSGHYDAGGIETIEIIRAKLTPEQFYGYCLGNVLKYLCRANHKGDPERDLEKAGVYMGWAREIKNQKPEVRGQRSGMGGHEGKI